MLTLVDAIRFTTHALKSVLRYRKVGKIIIMQILVIFKNKKEIKEDKWFLIFLNAVGKLLFIFRDQLDLLIRLIQ